MTFKEITLNEPVILMEGAVIERLRRSQSELVHPRLAIAPLVRTEDGRNALTAIYREYISIVLGTGFPLILHAPTWRISQDRCEEENIQGDLNAEAVQFMQSFKKELPKLFIGGMVGCKNDCYKPQEALSQSEAAAFHTWQIERLTDADFLSGVTLPEVNEALGIAQAMAETDRPCIISFVIGKDGQVLDGTSLEQAIDLLDSKTEREPLGYGVSCCYPSFLQKAELSTSAANRMLSIQGNASSLSHEELENADSLHCDPIDDWVRHMIDQYRKLNLKMLGGCCGTTTEHIRQLKEAL